MDLHQPDHRETTERAAEPAASLKATGASGVRRSVRFLGVLAALTLVALSWIGARDAVRVHRAETLARVQAELANQALALEEQLRQQFLAVDQTLRLLEASWEADPTRFDLEAWRRQAVMLSDISLMIFLADEHGRVRASTRSNVVGANVSDRDYFRHEAAARHDEGRMFVGSVTQGHVTKLWQINMARRLDRPDGSFAGLIAVSYDLSALTEAYRRLDLGRDGLAMVVTRSGGRILAATRPAGSDPGGSIAGSPLFAALTAQPDGRWIGPSAPDGVTRIHAFRAVPGRDLEIVVGLDKEQAMRPAAAWDRSAWGFATGTSILVLVAAALALRAESVGRRRQETLARERAALAEKTAFLEATFASMSDGVMILDADLRIIEWNEKASAFTGVPREMLRAGVSMEELVRTQAKAGEFGPVDVEAEVARRMALLRSEAAAGTIERSRPGGRFLELRRSSIAGGGFVTLYRDTTQRHHAEEQLREGQKMVAIGRLTAGIAHDFNNLLASIMGNAELLERHLRNEPAHARRLSIIQQAATRGANVVQQLLTFSRKQPVAPIQVDLNALVRGMSDLLRSTLGASIRIEISEFAGQWPALADPVLVEQVVLNLAINARDAMPDGGVLTISTGNQHVDTTRHAAGLPDGDYVVLTVTDTGSGMTEEVQRNAFEPFFTTKPPGQGSGLGLSQVYGITHQSGGGVEIESHPGQGTTIRVYLPRATGTPAVVRTHPAASGVAGGLRPAAAPGRDALRGRTVLMVEDDPGVRETVSAMLTELELRHVVAEDGPKALSLAAKGTRFDLLLADFAMPGMNGVEVADALRRERPHLPVVFMTGYQHEGRFGGERWVLTKPFTSATLEKALSEAFRQHADPARSPAPI